MPSEGRKICSPETVKPPCSTKENPDAVGRKLRPVDPATTCLDASEIHALKNAGVPDPPPPPPPSSSAVIRLSCWVFLVSTAVRRLPWLDTVDVRRSEERRVG